MVRALCISGAGMSDATDAPLLLQRPLNARRVYFIAPAEPKDKQTFDRLCAKALAEVRDQLLQDAKAAALLARIGRTGKDGPIKTLQDRISGRVSATLAGTKERQPIKSATVSYSCSPIPSEGRVCGTLIVRAWGHTLRTTFDPELSK